MSTEGTERLGTDDLAEVEISEEPLPPPRGFAPKRAPEPDPEAEHDRAGRRLLIGIGVAAAVVFGLTIWALVTRSQRNDARDRVAALEQEKRDLEDALELHRATKMKLATCEEEREVEKEINAKNLQRTTEAEMLLQVCHTAKVGLEQQTEEARKRQAELDRLTARFRQMVDSGDLSVKIRRGQMVVQLPSAVLFRSGKADLSKRGKKTLTGVAKILRSLPRRKFTVAGHTDNRPLGKGDDFANNWELSSARAVQVTRHLIGAGVAPRNLVAAGYGQYAPIASNRTRRGRQLNRRIEIILEPDLEKLPAQVLNKRKRKKRNR